MSRQRTFNLMLALLLAGGLAACDESAEVLEPFGSPEGTELDLAVDDDLTDAILADAEAALNAVSAPAPGIPGLFAAPNEDFVDEARALLEQARQKFIEARRAWTHGDTELAAELAFEGRLLIAEALVLVFGEDAYADLLLRVDNVIAWLEEEVDGRNSDLLDRIRELRQEAVDIREGGGENSLVEATERLILALQIGHRERAHHRRQEIAQHAQHAIIMASVAIDFAVEIIGDDPNERQAHLLRHALQLRNEAVAVFERGRFRLAFSLAREAVNVALVAVLLEPGSDVSKVDYMIGVSDGAIAAGQEALNGFSADTFLPQLLEHAQRLQNHAIQIKDRDPRRAVHILWYSSITAWAVVLLVEGASGS